MSIILEGVDGTGKTFFTDQWMALNPAYIRMHNYVKPQNKIDMMSECAKELLIMQFVWSPYIMDRSFIISEYVYSQVLGRSSLVTMKELANVVEIINKNGIAFELFAFKDKSLLPIKPEDKALPHEELNKLYLYLFTNKFKLRRMNIHWIEDWR